MPPVRASGGGGGKGMIVALLGVGGLLLIAIAVVVVRSMKPATEETTLTNPFTSSSGVATIAPQVDTGALPTTAADSDDVRERRDGGHGGETQPQPQSESEPEPHRQDDTRSQACDACIAAANGGNIQGAAAKYRQCNDPGKKARCTAAVKGKAPQAAQAAAYNGQCGKAKAIGAAASAMGAGSGPLQAAVNSCK